jgi:hypothetical protein
MHSTLSTVQRPPATSKPLDDELRDWLREEDVPDGRREGRPEVTDRGNERAAAAVADPNGALEGGFRFWACAHGPEGRSQTTAVWGLWLDQTVVFAADTESVAVGDPRAFPASVVQVDEDGELTVVDGSAERVDDPWMLSRFVSACAAKYGFEPDPRDPDTPVYVVRPSDLQAAGAGVPEPI